MNAEIILSSPKNLMDYMGKSVKVVPRLTPPKIQFKLNPKKGCGQVVRKI